MAVAAARACDPAARAASPGDFLRSITDRTPAGAVRAGLDRAAGLPEGASVRLAVAVLGNGVGLSAVDTVPFALWCAARHRGDFAAALWEAVAALGDRDTICAIVGGVVALSAGPDGIPADWAAAREPVPAWLLA